MSYLNIRYLYTCLADFEAINLYLNLDVEFNCMRLNTDNGVIFSPAYTQVFDQIFDSSRHCRIRLNDARKFDTNTHIKTSAVVKKSRVQWIFYFSFVSVYLYLM